MLLKQGEKIAFCGVLCALSAVFVVGAGLFPTMTYALPAIAGVLLVAAVMELGKKWAFFSYVVVGLLSLLLGTDKEAACFFCLFFGYYPTLKSLLDPLRSRVIQWLLKLLVFNAAAVLLYLIAVYLLGLPQESFSVAEYGGNGCFCWPEMRCLSCMIGPLAVWRSFIGADFIPWLPEFFESKLFEVQRLRPLLSFVKRKRT